MRLSRSFLLLFVLLCESASALQFTGRASLLGTMIQTDEGEFGYQVEERGYDSNDQQSLRLMLEQDNEHSGWAIHLRSLRQRSDIPINDIHHSSQLFRYNELGENFYQNGNTTVRYEFDRFYYKLPFEHHTLTAGRHAIDWGTGRFWQPLNLFGSFSPTDLDTDYKPGIDAISLDHYPSALSSLTAVYTLAPKNQNTIENSGAIHYRRQVGDISELALVAGNIVGNKTAGAAFESAWGGMGWRIEGIFYQTPDQAESPARFWIAGIDYQFSNGSLLSAEYYDNSRGASRESELAGGSNDLLIASGLQQQHSRRLFGLSLGRDITPLLRGQYTLLNSVLREENGEPNWSHLQQFSLNYSLSNESDLLTSVSMGSGKTLNNAGEPRSEFGHIPLSLTLRLRLYF